MGVTGRCWCRQELVALLQLLHPLLDRHPAGSVLGFAYSIREVPVESKGMAGAVGRNTTIEDATYRGVPNPEI